MFKLIQTRSFDNGIRGLRDRKTKRILAGRISRLEQGLFGDAKSVGDGVFELRVHFGPGYRIYYQLRGTDIILLLCGGDKSTQSADIKRARSISKAWEI